MPPLKLPYLKIFRGRTGWRTYYRRNGQTIKIAGEINSPEWHKEYQRIHASFEHLPEQRLPDSLASVIASYVKTPRYQRLSHSTKKSYDLELAWLAKHFGATSVKHIGRREVVRLRDLVAKKESPRKAIKRVLALRVTLLHAQDLGYIERNPTDGVGKPDAYKAVPHRPWGEDELALFLAGARPVMRRAVMVLLHTGLRRDDALRLTRAHIQSGMIHVVPGKTADTHPDEVVIPITDDLAAELATSLAVESLHLMPNERGMQWHPSSVSHMVAKEARRLGIESPAPLHGLRKNAVRRLLEVGLDHRTINAITGQSEAMIKHYGKGYDRRRLAEAAVIKLRALSPSN